MMVVAAAVTVTATLSREVSAKGSDCPLKYGVARVGYLVTVSVVTDEGGEVGAGICVEDVGQKIVKLKSPINDMTCRWGCFLRRHTENKVLTS